MSDKPSLGWGITYLILSSLAALSCALLAVYEHSIPIGVAALWQAAAAGAIGAMLAVRKRLR